PSGRGCGFTVGGASALGCGSVFDGRLTFGRGPSGDTFTFGGDLVGAASSLPLGRGLIFGSVSSFGEGLTSGVIFTSGWGFVFGGTVTLGGVVIGGRGRGSLTPGGSLGPMGLTLSGTLMLLSTVL